MYKVKIVFKSNYPVKDINAIYDKIPNMCRVSNNIVNKEILLKNVVSVNREDGIFKGGYLLIIQCAIGIMPNIFKFESDILESYDTYIDALDMIDYTRHTTKYLGFSKETEEQKMAKILEIEKIICNEPCTIVLWKDGTKTVVRCQEGETYDKEKGLAMAIAKKAFGNNGRYYELFKLYIPECNKEDKHE